MNDEIILYPKHYHQILEDTDSLEFNQLSSSQVGSLLSTLAAAKPNGCFLELRTGSGLSTSWLLHGMEKNSSLITVDEDSQLINIAKKHFSSDIRVNFIESKGENVILNTAPNSIDFIFADTWPGKYFYLDETLSLLKKNGLYIIDDMLPQENWPDKHAEKAAKLIEYLESRDDIILSKLCWSTGIIICTKIDHDEN